MTALPDIPRRCDPAAFMRQHGPALAAALRPVPPPALPVALAWEVEVEAASGAAPQIFSYTLETDGRLRGEEPAAGRADASAPWAVVVLDEPAFAACYELLVRWHRQRQQRGDLGAVRAWLAGLAARWGGRLPRLRALLDEHPATVELVLTDLAGERHVVTLELGEPGEGDPLLRLHLRLADVELAPHEADEQALAALARARVRVEGAAEWLARLGALVS